MKSGVGEAVLMSKYISVLFTAALELLEIILSFISATLRLNFMRGEIIRNAFEIIF